MSTACANCSIRIVAMTARTTSATRAGPGPPAARSPSDALCAGSTVGSGLESGMGDGPNCTAVLASVPVLVSEFDFALPDELIAQAAAPRGASKLMTLDRASGAVAH